MKTYKYIHIFPNEKFINSFVETIDLNFNIEEHFFIYLEGKSIKEFPINFRDNNLIILSFKEFFIKRNTIQNKVEKSNKIFIHGFYKWYFILFLNLQNNILPKSYWIMWGSDLYEFNKNSIFDKLKTFFRKNSIKKIGNLVTYIEGDYELAKKWYGAIGNYHECFMYPSNLYKKYEIKEKKHTTINIQVGNSADSSNNHLKVFEKLKKYKDEDINIFVPLSYGDEKYAQDVILKGQELFGGKFKPMTDFMPFDKYLEFLGEIDIAIFAHRRQQAMGNIITLLGLGKKIYMQNDITPWKLFKDINVKVFDFDDIEIDLIDNNVKKENQQKIKKYFSKKII